MCKPEHAGSARGLVPGLAERPWWTGSAAVQLGDEIPLSPREFQWALYAGSEPKSGTGAGRHEHRRWDRCSGLSFSPPTLLPKT